MWGVGEQGSTALLPESFSRGFRGPPAPSPLVLGAKQHSQSSPWNLPLVRAQPGFWVFLQSLDPLEVPHASIGSALCWPLSCPPV